MTRVMYGINQFSKTFISIDVHALQLFPSCFALRKRLILTYLDELGSYLEIKLALKKSSERDTKRDFTFF